MCALLLFLNKTACDQFFHDLIRAAIDALHTCVGPHFGDRIFLHKSISAVHGGYGFMQEYAVAEMWTDARVQRIYGGTNEIMKELIARGFVEKKK